MSMPCAFISLAHGLKLGAGLVVVSVDDEHLPADGSRLLGGRPTLEPECRLHRGLVLALGRNLAAVVDVDDLAAPAPHLVAQVVREALAGRDPDRRGLQILPDVVDVAHPLGLLSRPMIAGTA